MDAKTLKWIETARMSAKNAAGREHLARTHTRDGWTFGTDGYRLHAVKTTDTTTTEGAPPVAHVMPSEEGGVQLSPGEVDRLRAMCAAAIAFEKADGQAAIVALTSDSLDSEGADHTETRVVAVGTGINVKVDIPWLGGCYGVASSYSRDSVGFDAHYLQDALKMIPKGTGTFLTWNKGGDPLRIGFGDCVALVMPRRY